LGAVTINNTKNTTTNDPTLSPTDVRPVFDLKTLLNTSGVARPITKATTEIETKIAKNPFIRIIFTT
jgi:hypothetical protein